MEREDTKPVIIEKGVPFQESQGMWPLRDLQVGESFALPTDKRDSVQSMATRIGVEEGKVFTIRKNFLNPKTGHARDPLLAHQVNAGLNRGRSCSCGAPKSALTHWCMDCWKAIPPIDKHNIIRALENLAQLIRDADLHLEKPRRLNRVISELQDDASAGD